MANTHQNYTAAMSTQMHADNILIYEEFFACIRCGKSVIVCILCCGLMPTFVTVWPRNWTSDLTRLHLAGLLVMPLSSNRFSTIWRCFLCCSSFSDTNKLSMNGKTKSNPRRTSWTTMVLECVAVMYYGYEIGSGCGDAGCCTAAWFSARLFQMIVFLFRWKDTASLLAVGMVLVVLVHTRLRLVLPMSVPLSYRRVARVRRVLSWCWMFHSLRGRSGRVMADDWST